jgi:hypothetical protein
VFEANWCWTTPVESLSATNDRSSNSFVQIGLVGLIVCRKSSESPNAGRSEAVDWFQIVLFLVGLVGFLLFLGGGRAL